MASSDEEEEVGVLRGEHDDHDVGDAGDGQRDEGGVDDGDEEDAEEAEVEEEGEERVGMTAGRGGDCAAAATIDREAKEAAEAKIIGIRRS